MGLTSPHIPYLANSGADAEACVFEEQTEALSLNGFCLRTAEWPGISLQSLLPAV